MFKRARKGHDKRWKGAREQEGTRERGHGIELREDWLARWRTGVDWLEGDVLKGPGS